MTIRKKFSIGILSAVILLVLTAMMVFSFRQLLFNDSPFLNYLSYRDNLMRFKNSDDLTDIVNELAVGKEDDFFDYLLIDSSDHIIWHSIENPSFPKTVIELECFDENLFVAGVLENKLKDKHFIVESVYNDNLDLQLILFYYKSIFHNGNDKFQIVFSVVLLIFLFLITVPLVFNILFSRTGALIRDLVDATNKVAAGDLDFEIERKGSDELSILAASFDTMRKSLLDARHKQTHIIMGVSHDLKTPLTSIEGFVQVIRDGMADDPEKMNHYLDIISNKTHLLGARIVELIDYVKMESGEWHLKAENIDLQTFMMDIADIYREESYVYKKEFDFVWDLKKDVVIKADLSLFTRILENLLNNAFRYTAQDDSIALSCRRIDRDEVEVEVRDTGQGIDKEDLNYIFDPLYRGTRTRNEKGFGLGLSIVKSIVEAHRWRISVKSEQGRFTSFFLTIPIKYQVDDTSERLLS